MNKFCDHPIWYYTLMNYFLFTFLYRHLCTVKLNQLATSQLQHPILLVMQILTSMHHFWIFKKIKQVKEHILIPVSLKKKKKKHSHLNMKCWICYSWKKYKYCYILSPCFDQKVATSMMKRVMWWSHIFFFITLFQIILKTLLHSNFGELYLLRLQILHSWVDVVHLQ